MSAEPPELLPIRTVASLTGVNPVTLRAWERRYGLVVPRRTEKGHRLYSRADVDRIHRVVDLLDRGMPVGRVRTMLDADIPAASSATGDPWSGYQARLLAAIARFDAPALEEVHDECLGLHPVDVVIDRLVVPTFASLGEAWRERGSGIAEEHFFSVVLRNKIGARFHHLARRARGPRLLAACLPGDLHEMGLLLFSLAAADHGYRPVPLGAGMPLEGTAIAARRAGCAAIVLGASIDPARQVLDEGLPGLVAAVDVPVCLGGRTAIAHHDALVAAGVTPLGESVPAAMRRLSALLGEASTPPMD